MKGNNRACFIAGLLAILFLAGCGMAKPAAVQVDSGVINDQYKGNVKAGLPQVIKITEEEMKNGVEKVPIKSDSRLREAAQPEEEQQQDAGGGHAKPKI
jgi:hypothetical protein